ncbi:MAG TPA: hypothetical protein HA222_04250 [Candidatus Diapherotrites archaeon]|uniref:Uncharacterized protein n=1 Tax=Candidatus Iainarchaeum sp. TaxID=3101447 RepID=A0A7J4JXY7_9ARCH|nr:hypothetical protein [Candidatus Diapherotrites archaeon]
MAENSVILDSVRKMLKSGLDDDIIRSTLVDFGLGEKEIQQVLAEAKGEKPKEKPAMEKPVEKKQVQEQQALEEEPLEREQAGSENDFEGLRDSATQNVFEEHSAKIDEVSEKIDGLHERISSVIGNGSFSSEELDSKLSSLNSRLDSISADVKELKAGTNALVELLKKVLETDREVLHNLERKK